MQQQNLSMEGLIGGKMNSVLLLQESDVEGWIAIEIEEDERREDKETFEEIYEKLKKFLVEV